MYELNEIVIYVQALERFNDAGPFDCVVGFGYIVKNGVACPSWGSVRGQKGLFKAFPHSVYGIVYVAVRKEGVLGGVQCAVGSKIFAEPDGHDLVYQASYTRAD